MKKATLMTALFMFLSVFCAVLTILPENAKATTLFVGGAGPGNFTTIQEAIIASSPGDTIYVYSGTFSENVVVSEPLSLVGEDRNTTIIDGGGAGSVVTAAADWVNISGFTVTNSGLGPSDAGVAVSSSSSIIVSNISALNNSIGIFLLSSDNNTIVDSYTFNNTEGIYLDSSNHNGISFSLAINNKNGVRLDNSNNNTVMHNDMSDRNICVGLEFSQFNSVSNNTMLDCIYGIDVWHSDNNTFAGNNISWNDGVYLEYSSKNVFLNNTISNNPDGISIDYSSDLTFHGNVMVGNGFFLWDSKVLEHWNSHTIDLSNTVNGRPVYYWKNITGGSIPAGAGQVLLYNCTNVVVDNQNLSAASNGVNSFISSDLTISNNSVSSNSIGIWLQNATYGNITANIMTDNPWDMFIKQSDRVNISNNSGPNDRGVWLYDSHNSTFVNNSKSIKLEHSNDNVVMGNNVSSGRGFEVAGSNDNVLSFNSISTNWGWWGVLFEGAFRNTLVNNTVFNSTRIELQMSSNNMIRNNTLTNNGLGLMLEQSTENLIENNTISMSNETGIDLIFLSGSNTFANNTLSENGFYGIRVYDSSDNAIYHNEFVNNFEQAFNDANCSNAWDNGYPSGGNYWSDYNGTDSLRGPNQNQPGGDGIGDTPYNIQGGNDRDRYPLTGPFETIHPLPPVILSAYLTGPALENVTLTWDLSFDDGGGFGSVIGYRIYRNTNYSSDGSGYALIATLINGTSGFVDSLAGEGDPNNYFYRVCSFDAENHMRCAVNQAGKFTRPLSKEQTLASIPLIQSDESIETVLQTVSFDQAWTFNPVNSKWESFMKPKPHLGSLRSLNRSMGFWLNVTENSNLTVAGVVPSGTGILLHAGWNLVGFPSFQGNLTVGDLKAIVSVESVEGFDASKPPYFLRSLTDGEFLQTGLGYWMNMSTDDTWTVINS